MASIFLKTASEIQNSNLIGWVNVIGAASALIEASASLNYDVIRKCFWPCMGPGTVCIIWEFASMMLERERERTTWREARSWQKEDWLDKQQAVTSYLLYKTSRFTTSLGLSITTMLTYRLFLSSFSRSRGPSNTNRSHGVRATTNRSTRPRSNQYFNTVRVARARIGPPPLA